MPRRILTHDKIIFPAIWINSIVIFLLAYGGLCNNPWLQGADYFFTVFFTVEMAFKMQQQGARKFFRDKWNVFDFVIVVLSLPSIIELFVPIHYPQFLLIFRLIRSFKLFLFFQFIPNVQSIIRGSMRAFKASFFVIAGLAIYAFILSILCTQLFRDSTPQFFSSPTHSLYTLFQIFTIEGWNVIPDTIAANDPSRAGWVRFFFSAIVLTGGMIGFSIVNAIYVDSFSHEHKENMGQEFNDLKAEISELHHKIDQLIQEKRSGSGDPPPAA